MSAANAGRASAAAWESVNRWYQEGPYAQFVAEARLPADSALQLMRIAQPAGHFPDPPTPSVSLALLTRGFDMGQFDFGEGRFREPGRPGGLCFAPAGIANDYKMDTPHEFLLVTLPGKFVCEALTAIAPKMRDHGVMHRGIFRDGSIESLIRLLWSESAQGNPMGSIYVKDVAFAISDRLATLALKLDGCQLTRAESAPPLHGARLKRVLSRIDDELARNLQQEELAETAGLTQWHFCRAFKTATGCSPHRFVTMRRLARAQQLMRETSLPLSQVALASGFSDHAHLSVVFRRILGHSPSSWRSSNCKGAVRISAAQPRCGPR